MVSVASQNTSSLSHTFPVGRKDRRKALKSQYYFTCNCDSCEDSWPLFTEISSDIKFK